jgi:hypothetical protein
MAGGLAGRAPFCYLQASALLPPIETAEGGGMAKGGCRMPVQS